MDAIQRVFLLALALAVCSGCQSNTDAERERPDPGLGKPCQVIPDLPVPAGLPDTLTRHLKWVNHTYTYTENNPYTAMHRDTVSELERIASVLENNNCCADLYLFLARAKRLIAFNLQNEDRYGDSYALLKESLRALEAHRDTSSIAAYELGYHYNLIGYYGLETSQAEIALSYANKSLEINAAHGFLTEAIKEYLNISVAYGNIERYDLQQEIFAEAHTLAIANEHCFKTPNDIGIMANLIYSKALYRFVEARRELFKGDTVNALGNLDSALANFAVAKQRVRKAELQDELYIQFKFAALESNIAISFPFVPGLRDSAVATVENILAKLPEGHPYHYLFQLRALQISSGAEDKCKLTQGTTYRNLLSYLDDNPFKSVPLNLQLTYLTIKGSLALLESDCGQASENPELVQSAHERVLDWITDFEYLVGSADLELNLENIGGNWRGQYAIAEDVIARSVSYFNARNQASEFSEDLLSLSDRSKSMSLRLALEKRKGYELYGAYYQELYGRLTALRKAIREAERSSTQALAAQDSLTAFFSALQQSTLPYKVQFFNDLRYFDQVSKAEIQRELLTDGRAAVDIFYGRSELIVSAITKQEARQWVLPINQAFADAISGLGQRDASGNKSAAHAHLIYKLALKPTFDWLAQFPAVKEVIVVRDKELVDFAFEYFPTEPVTGSGWSAGALLGDRYAITYAYSFSTLLAARAIQSARSSAPKLHGAFLATEGFSVGGRNIPALPGFGASVKKSVRSIAGGTDLMERTTAGQFTQMAMAYRFLTIAGHGYEEELEAERYFLQFHPGQGSKGRISTSEIYAMLLPTELTVLLNCESARGSKHNFEGRKSLARSFLYAGSSAVIAGNSQLSDATYPEITAEFYRLWTKEGLPAHLALHQAKMTYRDQHPELPPHLWGELIYYGLPDIYFSVGPTVLRTDSERSVQ